MGAAHRRRSAHDIGGHGRPDHLMRPGKTKQNRVCAPPSPRREKRGGEGKLCGVLTPTLFLVLLRGGGWGAGGLGQGESFIATYRPSWIKPSSSASMGTFKSTKEKLALAY